MRITSSMLYNNLLNGVAKQQAIQDQGNAKIASGTRFQTPAQSGLDYKVSLDLRHSQTSVQSSVDATITVESRLSISQTLLNDMSNVMKRVEVLSVQQSSAQLGSAERQAALQEMNHLFDQFLSDSNQQFEGQSLFAGTATDRPAFVTNPFNAGTGAYTAGTNTSISAVGIVSNPNAVNESYTMILDAAGTSIASITNGAGTNLLAAPIGLATGANTALLSNGTQLSLTYSGIPDVVNAGAGVVAVSGATVLGSASYNGSDQDRIVSVSLNQQIVSNVRGDRVEFLNAFSALQGFQTALLNNDSAAIQTSVGEIISAGNGMIDLTADAGARLNAVRISKVAFEDMKLNLDIRLNNHEAVDIPAVVAELQQSSIALQAAYSQIAQIKTLSLMNFLR